MRISNSGSALNRARAGFPSRSAVGTEGLPSARPSASPFQREADFARSVADWAWETDEALRLTLLSRRGSGRQSVHRLYRHSN